MGIFDWVPTIDEVIDYWDCRISGHKYKMHDDGKIRCEVCDKEKVR